MTTTQAVETSVTVYNSPIQNYPHPDNLSQFIVHFGKIYKSNMGRQSFIDTEWLIDWCLLVNSRHLLYTDL